MKNKEKKDEFKHLSAEALKQRVQELRHELFSSKINAMTAQMKDNSQFQKMRKNIARCLTYLQQKEAANNK